MTVIEEKGAAVMVTTVLRQPQPQNQYHQHRLKEEMGLNDIRTYLLACVSTLLLIAAPLVHVNAMGEVSPAAYKCI